MTRGATDTGTIDPAALRAAFGSFVTGVTIVTVLDDEGRPRGITANSFTSVSMDPPLLLVCVAKSASSYPAFAATGSFAVNLLHDGQVDLSGIFASKSPDKFVGVTHAPVNTGAPVLAESLTWFDCSVHQRVDAGDHMILIGRIEAFETSASPPLGFCRGRYAKIHHHLKPGAPRAHDMFVGYLIDTAGGLLLQAHDDQRWTLPTARQRRADSVLTLDCGETLHLVPDSIFPYSLFDISEQDPGYLIYRARSADGPTPASLPAGLQVFAIDDLPFDRLVSRELAAVLRRYARERQSQRFGLYIDLDTDGRVAMIDDAFLPGAPLSTALQSGT